MKYLLLWMILIFICATGYCQELRGIVIDKSTGQPVSGALISSGSLTTYTTKAGEFLLSGSLGDSIKIVHFAYEPYRIAVNKAVKNMRVELEPRVTTLNEVTIRGSKDFKKDSIENRLAYAKQFNYTGPTIKEAFSGNPNKQWGELISVNPLLLIAALTKKSSPEYKFKKMLIADEHEQYIDEHFNRGVVSQIVPLQADTLSTFLLRYRPTYEFVKKSTGYEIDIYIKESYKKSKADGFKSAGILLDSGNKNVQPVKLN